MTRAKKITAALLMCLIVFSLFVSCGEKDTTIHVKGIMLNFAEHTFNSPDESLLLSAVVLPSDAENKNVTWQNSDPNVVSIDGNNKVVPMTNGEATITVTTEDGEFSATCKIIVNLPEVEPPELEIAAEGIIVDKKEHTFTKAGETIKLIVDVTPYNATNNNVSWASSDSSVATVDEDGTVTSVKNGKTTITVTTEDGGFTETCEITVEIETSSNNNNNNSNNNSQGSTSTTKLPSIPAAKLDSDGYLVSDNLLDFNKINSDAIAWLYVPGTNMNFPVVQTVDNDYYLDKGLDKKSKYTGSCYIDYRNTLKTNGTFIDSNTILYGHAKGTDIFDQLENETQKSSWFDKKSNLYIYVNTLTEQTVWQVFACYYTDTSIDGNYYLDVHYYLDNDTITKNMAALEYTELAELMSDPGKLDNFMTDHARFLSFMTSWRNRIETKKYSTVGNYLKSRDYGVKLEEGDKVITLSTCADAEGPNRYVLQAKLIKSRPRQ